MACSSPVHFTSCCSQYSCRRWPCLTNGWCANYPCPHPRTSFPPHRDTYTSRLAHQFQDIHSWTSYCFNPPILPSLRSCDLAGPGSRASVLLHLLYSEAGSLYELSHAGCAAFAQRLLEQFYCEQGSEPRLFRWNAVIETSRSAWRSS